jgi:hypothetical protein
MIFFPIGPTAPDMDGSGRQHCRAFIDFGISTLSLFILVLQQFALSQ